MERLFKPLFWASAGYLPMVWLWEASPAYLLPATLALIIANAALSLSVLFKRGRISRNVILLNCLQLPLFAILHAQLFALGGDALYLARHDPAWYDWLELVVYYGLKAADVVDLLEEYGLLTQAVQNTGLLSGMLILAMNLLLGLFLLGALIPLFLRSTADTAFQREQTTFYRLVHRAAPVGLLLLCVLYWILFWRYEDRNPVHFNLFQLELWPLEQILRTMDIGDAFLIFRWRLHDMADHFSLSALAICFRALLSIYLIEWMGILFLRLSGGRGRTASDLGETLASGSHSLEDRQIAARALKRLGPDAMPALPCLIHAMAENIGAVQRAALAVLVEMDRRAIPRLAPYLAHPSRQVREMVETALSRIAPDWEQDARGTEVVDPLINALLDADLQVRHAAAEALTRIDPGWAKRPEALASVPVFTTALGHPDPRIRLAGVEALARLGPPASLAVFRLIKARADENGHVRHAAAEALERINPEWCDTEAAVTALAHLARAAAEGDRDVQEAVPEVMGQIGAPAAAHLVDLFLSDSEFGAPAAEAVLMRFGSKALPAVLARYDAAEKPQQVEIIRLIGRLGIRDGAAVACLKKAASHPHTADAARSALARIRPPESTGSVRSARPRT